MILKSGNVDADILLTKIVLAEYGSTQKVLEY